MKLQPLDIRRQSFAKAFRGYEPVEVDAFLKQVADQQAALMEEVRQMEDRVRDAEAKLKHYERVELALQEALETARETGKRAEESAERQMRAIVQSAEARAEEILREAERERYALQQDVRKLSTRQTEVAAKLRGFLMSELEILAQFQGDEPVGFLKLQPASMPAALPPAAPDPQPAERLADAPPPSAGDLDGVVPPDVEPEAEGSYGTPASETAEASTEDETPAGTPDRSPVDETPGLDDDRPTADDPSPAAPPVAEGAPLADSLATEESPPAEAPSGFARWFGGASRSAAVPPAPELPNDVPSDVPSDVPDDPEPAPPVPETVPEPVVEAPSAPPDFAPLPSVAPPSDPAPPLWDLRSLVTGASDDATVAGSEAERDRIRRILDDLD